MPVYEFYCPDCHTIFNFFSRRVNTEACPACPRCERPELERQISLFAISSGRKDDEEGEGPMPDLDDPRMERAMMALAAEAEKLDDDDPRQAAQFMRKLCETTGMELNAEMKEMIRRMEAGEDPDKLDEELGEGLDDFDPFGEIGVQGLKHLRQQYTRPKVDETLYEL